MIIGKVISSIVSTRKNENLMGSKFLVVEPLEIIGGKSFVAVDNVGAGIGETVLVAKGSAARVGTGMEKSPVDAVIVGIVDDARGLE
ncbi:MAG: ethanolamine utilization protein EutN [Ruminococcaceae bacterium]|nr:ethanolamine utilization protein EutN [Oscillospiraceae bacterium]